MIIDRVVSFYASKSQSNTLTLCIPHIVQIHLNVDRLLLKCTFLHTYFSNRKIHKCVWLINPNSSMMRRSTAPLCRGLHFPDAMNVCVDAHSGSCKSKYLSKALGIVSEDTRLEKLML